VLYYTNLLFGISMDTELKTNQDYRDKAIEQGFAVEIRPNFLMFSTLSNERLSFETFEEYKFRQKMSKIAVKKFLKKKK